VGGFLTFFNFYPFIAFARKDIAGWIELKQLNPPKYQFLPDITRYFLTSSETSESFNCASFVGHFLTYLGILPEDAYACWTGFFSDDDLNESAGKMGFRYSAIQTVAVSKIRPSPLPSEAPRADSIRRHTYYSDVWPYTLS
jgi:hypothetical protein